MPFPHRQESNGSHAPPHPAARRTGHGQPGAGRAARDIIPLFTRTCRVATGLSGKDSQFVRACSADLLRHFRNRATIRLLRFARNDMQWPVYVIARSAATKQSLPRIVAELAKCSTTLIHIVNDQSPDTPGRTSQTPGNRDRIANLASRRITFRLVQPYGLTLILRTKAFALTSAGVSCLPLTRTSRNTTSLTACASSKPFNSIRNGLAIAEMSLNVTP